MDWLQVVGLFVDMAGALVIGWPLIRMTDDEAIGIGLATIASGKGREDDLQQPTVRALLRQRAATQAGILLLLLGFALQAVSRF